MSLKGMRWCSFRSKQGALRSARQGPAGTLFFFTVPLVHGLRVLDYPYSPVFLHVFRRPSTSALQYGL
jgi:hypothetical protein